MKILYINTFDPYAEAHGGATVTRKELELVRQIGDVTTLFSQPLNKRIYHVNPFRLFGDVAIGKSLKQSSYGVLHHKPEFYKEFDIIFCNHDFSAYDYKSLIKLRKPFIVRKLNAEHRFYRSDRYIQKIERERIHRFEKQLGRAAFCVIHLSSSEFLNDDYSRNKQLLFPPLVSDDLLRASLNAKSYRHAVRPIDILCVTNFEWNPNREGFDWFFDQVAPRLGDHINIHLVGKGSGRYATYPGVRAHGFVEDVSQFYETSKLFISPVLSGAGIKIKNLEAMIHGVPVVSTPLGVDGLSDVSTIGGVTVAETSDLFANHLHSLLADEARCILQQEAAYSRIRSNVNGPAEWSSRVKRLIEQAVCFGTSLADEA
jgi:glycosyltransferase involved in cell wall biosynthesis